MPDPRKDFPLAIGRLLRQRRIALRLSLREVSARLAERGHSLPPSTLSRVESGKLAPRATALFLLLDLYAIPLQVAANLVVAGEPVTPAPSHLTPNSGAARGPSCD